MNPITPVLALSIARLHLNVGAMRTSARIALDDAQRCFDSDDRVHALTRALDSLAYSVGVFHPDYVRVQRATTACDCCEVTA